MSWSQSLPERCASQMVCFSLLMPLLIVFALSATTVLAWAQLLIAIPSLNSLTVAQLPHHTNAWKAPVSLTVPSAGKMAVIALRSDALTEAAKLIALAFLLLAQALFALMD